MRKDSATVMQVFEAFGAPAQRPAAARALRTLFAELRRSEPDKQSVVALLMWPTLLGDLDAAFESANRVLDSDLREDTVGTTWGFLWMPEMRPFRQDPRFQSLVTRLKLFDYWKQYGPPDDCDLHGDVLVCR